MIVYLHVPKCAGNSTSVHLWENNNLNTFLAYTKFISREISETVSSLGSFERMKAYLEHSSTVTGSPDVISGIGVFKGIEDYFTSSGSIEYHTRFFNPIDRAISMYKFRRGRYLGVVASPLIYKEGGTLIDFNAMMTTEFEKEDGTERSFTEWFEYFNNRTIDEYDMTSYENTLAVRGLTTDDFSWIGNENNTGNLSTLNVSPTYDTPERSVVEELVNTYWPNDMAIYNTSLAYNDITPSYLL